MAERGDSNRWIAVTIVIALLFAVLVAVAAVAMWLGPYALAEDRFVAATEEALGSGESREILAARAVGAVVDEFPVLAVFQAPAVDVLVVAFDSAALDGIRTTAAQDIHDRIITGGDAPVLVSLSQVRDAVLDPIAAIVPGVADSIPDELLDGIEIIEDDALPSLRTAATVSPWLAATSLIIALGLAATLFVLSPNRPLTVAALGFGTTLAGILALAAVPAARSIARGWATSEFAETLTIDVYERLVGSLLVVAAVLVVAGIVVGGGGVVWAIRRNGVDRADA